MRLIITRAMSAWLEHIFSSKTLNQASLGYDRISTTLTRWVIFRLRLGETGNPGADLGCSPSGTPIPEVLQSGSGSTDIDRRLLVPRRSRLPPVSGGTDIYSFKDVLDLIRGKHEIRTGLDSATIR